MRSFLLSFLALAGALSNSSGEEERPRWNIIAECQMVTLPQKTALALLPELSDDARIEAGFAKIQKLIETGEAKLIANLVGRALEGERAVAESVEEVRYPTEFNPPSERAEPQFLGITPTSFETRKVGTSLEFAISIDPSGTVLHASLVAQHVRFAGWRKFVAGVVPNGEKLSVEQPQFHTLQNSSILRLRNGQRVLFGVHKPAEPADTLELFIVRVSTSAAP